MTGDQETGASRVCFVRFALFRQFKLCFGLILRKTGRKRRESGWLWKLLNAKVKRQLESLRIGSGRCLN